MRVRWFALVALFALGCGDEEAPDLADTVDFASGEFQITTHSVVDECLDGGLNLLFMPEGDETPWGWEFPIELYAESELPRTYDIQLRDPFGAMTVNAVDSGVDLQQMIANKDGVSLGSQYGDCVANIDSVVEMSLVDSNTAEGLASLSLSNPVGDDCPVDLPPSCSVFLSIEAARQ